MIAKVSQREAEVLAAVVARLSNTQIANRLCISVRTVESHVASLLRKYGVADRQELAWHVAQTGVDPDLPDPPQPGIPTPMTSFIGREREHEAVLAAFGASRLVTLLGPGGAGKSRLAAEICSAYPAGGAFVDLVPARDGFVTQAAAKVLEVSERARQPLEDAVVERLRRHGMLLVLDNCEHVLDTAAGFAERVLAACPGTRILVTSRERLGVPGERTVAIGPLPLASDAEALFLDRATAADPEFDADPALLTEICARLDGIPLAIELAAARSASLGLAGLLVALDDTLRLLTGGRAADQRHRSLRAVLEWSHDLLDQEEQALFRRLSIFCGGFDLAAATALTAGRRPGAVSHVLGRLVDKSLVVRDPGAASRWRLLQTVRAFAEDLLRESGEHDAARELHLLWAAGTATAMQERLIAARQHGARAAAPIEGGRQDAAEVWRREFDEVADDLRAALAAAPPGPGGAGHGLARSLGHLTFARRFLAEAQSHYREAVERAPGPAEAAKDLRSAADCSLDNISGQYVFDLLLASAAQAHAAGDTNGRAVALARAVETAARFPASFPEGVPGERLRRHLTEAAEAGDPGDPIVAAALAAAAAWTARPAVFDPDPALAARALAVARATGDAVLISAALDAVTTAAVRAGRHREARRHSEERLALLSEMDRDDPRSAIEIVDTLHVACTDAIVAGDLPTAITAGRLMVADDLVGDHPYISASRLIPALVLTGDLGTALRYGERMWEGWERAGRPPAGWLLPSVSAIALAHGLLDDRVRFRLWRHRAGVVVDHAKAGHARLTSFGAFVDARAALHSGDLSEATGLVERAFGTFSMGRYEAYAQAAGAELAVVAGLPDAPDRLAAALLTAGENRWASACLARAGGRLHADPDALAASVAQWEDIDARLERAHTLLLIPHRAEEGRAALDALITSTSSEEEASEAAR
ncbi:LuxR C-terminal-related transcriptional regulator [Nonomuraea sp. NBC_01738]|uniref:ATP-binding protein n=1 Tax=Nonomuraea sp. NBC_01738 TaxID=2976003 RepID=UPI002E139E50|nr:LuxR C-terminal-related transcriptional regulator [Nonomuraea sp. NBC_01738]